MYVSPVFTGLEYLSFSAFGVGLVAGAPGLDCRGPGRNIRPGLGLRAIATPGVALTGALLLAVNFTWVMYSRVALLEATMVAALVAAWACYAKAERNWRWGVGAALLGLLAFFTKASAAFFLIALGLDACWVGWRTWQSRHGGAVPSSAGGAIATFAVLSVGTLVALAVFVVPHWADYSFYNLFVYGSRRSSMSVGALLDRASWFPVVHGFFTRQWLLSVASLCGLAAMLAGYRRATFRRAPARPLVPARCLRTGAARPGKRAAVRVPDSAHGLPGCAASRPRSTSTPGSGRHVVASAGGAHCAAAAGGLVRRLRQSDPAVPHARHPDVGSDRGAGSRHDRRRDDRHVAQGGALPLCASGGPGGVAWRSSR